MLAGCIEKMSARSCAGCTHRDTCAFVLPEALGFVLSSLRARSEPAGRTAVRRPPVLDFLGEVARGIRRNRVAREPTVRGKVERHVEPLLGGGPVRVESVARALGFSRQTLYRRLKAEGTSFEQLLDDLRRRVALRLVRDEGLPVKEAAWRTGFSDPAAFSRAFKRWTGVSPRGLRGRRLH